MDKKKIDREFGRMVLSSILSYFMWNHKSKLLFILVLVGLGVLAYLGLGYTDIPA